MFFNFRKDKAYYSCKCLEETVILHRDWYAICSMYGHSNSDFRPLFQWENGKFDYKKFLKVKQQIINQHKKGKIHKGCIGCKDLTKKEWEGKCDKLHHLHFRLSKKCNVNCIYCHDKIEGNDRLFLSDLKKLIADDIIAPDALMEFGGGEFSLHDECEEIVNYLIDSGFKRYKMYTSCMKFSPAYARALSVGDCDFIVSPDAGDRETFIRIKQADIYDAVWGNLKKYVEAQNENKYQVKAKFILLKGINDDDEKIKAFLEKSKEIGIKHVIFDLETNVSLSQQMKFNQKALEYLFSKMKYFKDTAQEVYGLRCTFHLNAETLAKKYNDFYNSIFKISY